MRLHRVVRAVTTLVAAAVVAVPVATAHAAPATQGAQGQAGAAAEAATAQISADGQSVIATLADARFRQSLERLDIVDAAGQVIDTLPLRGSLGGFDVPMHPIISPDAKSVTLTPVVSAELRSAVDAAAKNPAAKRISKAKRFDMMVAELEKGWRGDTPLFTLIGGLVGFIVFGWIGAGVGAAIGAYVGYQTSNPKAWPAVVAWWNTP